MVLVARRQNLLDEYVAELTAKGCKVTSKAADVSDTAALTKIFGEINSEFGAVAVLAYNAANMQGDKLTELTAKDILAHYKVDVAGALHCVKQVLPQMLAQKFGALLFTGGLFGVFPHANFVLYVNGQSGT